MKKLSLLSFFKSSNKNTMPKLVSGFTLIEIVVVIGIMAFFSAIIYSSFDTSRAKSRDQKRVSDVSTIQLALEQYFQKNGVYPLTLNKLLDTPSGSTNPYISVIPSDPTNVYENQYYPLTRVEGSPNCVSYHLWTTFEVSNVYLESKKGFNSLDSNLAPNNLNSLYFKCTGNLNTGIDASASSSSLVYDVMP